MKTKRGRGVWVKAIEDRDTEIAILKEALEKKYESPSQQQIRFMKERNDEQGAMIAALREEVERLKNENEQLKTGWHEVYDWMHAIVWAGSTRFYAHAVEWDRKAKQILEGKES